MKRPCVEEVYAHESEALSELKIFALKEEMALALTVAQPSAAGNPPSQMVQRNHQVVE